MTLPTDPHAPSKRAWLLLAAGLLLLLVFCLGSRGLNEPDEGRYANIACAMALSGDWWEPRMSGFGHYDKPPAIYWATAAGFHTFGTNEWSARLPSLTGALLALAGLGWAAHRLRGARVAWWAVLVCGTGTQFYVLGRILSPDMFLTGWCTLAIAAWAECRHRDGAWGWWVLSLVFWEAAWWTKATPALIPMAGLLVGVLASRDVVGRRALRAWLLFPAVLLFGAPWFLSMMSRHPELKHFFFGRELAGRMAGRVDGRHGSKLYYLPVSAAGWLPWWPLALWAAWKTRSRLHSSPGVSLIRTWSVRLGIEGWIVIVGLCIFSLAASKLPTYTLTLVPWASLGMARLISRLPGAAPEPDGAFQPLAWIGVAFALVISAAVVLIPHREASFGVNSSLREVCAFLHETGATRVDADQYWPSLEFYLGDDTPHYVMDNKHQQERATDPGLPPDRFVHPDSWPALSSGASIQARQAGDLWLVRFRKRKHSPFDRLIAQSRETRVTKTIGQFDLIHARIDEHGSLAVVPSPP